jgi:hypothetical protein
MNQEQKKGQRNEQWATHWKALRAAKGTVYASQGTIKRMPSFWYTLLCCKPPATARVFSDLGQRNATHLLWITYFREIRSIPGDRTPTQCLYSQELDLSSRNAADAIAWDLMLRLQYQLSNCQHPYFLAHSGSRINSRDIQAYWRENAERSLADILG